MANIVHLNGRYDLPVQMGRSLSGIFLWPSEVFNVRFVRPSQTVSPLTDMTWWSAEFFLEENMLCLFNEKYISLYILVVHPNGRPVIPSQMGSTLVHMS